MLVGMAGQGLKHLARWSVVWLLFANGCAQCRLPAIDPTGQRILLPSPSYTTLDSHHRDPVTGQWRHPLLDHLFKKHQGHSLSSCLGHDLLPKRTKPAFESPPDIPSCGTPALLGNQALTTLPPTPPADPTAPRVLVPGACQDPYQAAETTGNLHGGPAGAEPGATVTLSPLRQMAPVGTEVVLIGGVCDGTGYYRVREPLEWAISQGSVGNFVDPGLAVVGRLGLRGHFASLFSEPLPELLSNNYALSCTSKKVQVLTRGTVQTNDDILVEEGQGWVSLTSPIEGDTYVTLVAPDLDGWQQRTRTAVIHWIDGQWTIPPSIIAQNNEPQTLTTTVTRRITTAPIAGWIVRYEILDPSATFDDGTSVREVPTDALGQASIQVMPAAQQSGTARVKVQVIRPGVSGGPDRLVIGEGTTNVTWSTSQLEIRISGAETAEMGQTANYRIEVSNRGNISATDALVRALVPPGFELISSNPPAQSFGSRLDWNVPQLAPGQPYVIDLAYRVGQVGPARHCASVQSSGSSPIENCITTQVTGEELVIVMEGPNPDVPLPVGQEVRYRVNIENHGTRTLTNILVSDQFDPGLEHAAGTGSIDQTVESLGPNQTHTLVLQFRLAQEGRHCHTVEASATGVQPARVTACVQATQASAPEPEPAPIPNDRPDQPPPQDVPSDVRVTVRKTGPDQMTVGELNDFFIVVENTGDTPLTNLQVIDEYDPEFRPVGAEPPAKEYERGRVIWYLTQLSPGERQTFQVRCEAMLDVRSACSRGTVRGGDGWTRTDQRCLTILPAPANAQGNRPNDANPPRTVPGTGGEIPRGATPWPGADDGQTPPANANPALSGNLEVEIDDRAERWQIGDQIEYTILVRNARSILDSDVVVTIQLPNQVELISYDGPVTAANPSSDWRIMEMTPIQTLRPDETIKFSVLAKVISAGSMNARVVVKSLRNPEGITRQDNSLAQ